MSIRANSQLVLEVFRAIEQRDDKKFRDLLHRDFEIRWSPSLPYGRGDGGTWSETWEPLQPTATERKLDPRIIAASEDEVVAQMFYFDTAAVMNFLKKATSG